MYILGIETSCDETSVAVVKNGQKILACETNSSLSFHKKYGGVIPEIASRKQLENISILTAIALKKAKLRLKDIDLIAVTKEPGLLGSLLVGVTFARALSFGLKIPLVETNHLYSHIYASFLCLTNKKITLPFISLIVSGGHTSLFYVQNFAKINLLGATRDDACGEAFDKVAKILGLSYPGGPQIEKLAKKGNAKKIKFRCSETKSPLDFSFSGIKTAVLYLTKNKLITINNKADIAASFQETVIDTLIKKSLLACLGKKINRLVIGGGVAANNRLREKFTLAAKKNAIEIYFPDKFLCMDNAAMVAGIAYHLSKEE